VRNFGRRLFRVGRRLSVSVQTSALECPAFEALMILPAPHMIEWRACERQPHYSQQCNKEPDFPESYVAFSSSLHGVPSINHDRRIMADYLIKPDPDTKGVSPGALSEVDVYEDAGDLEFNEEKPWQELYLARIPKHVWESWSTLDEDAEITLGTVRATNVQHADGSTSVVPSSAKLGDIQLTFE